MTPATSATSTAANNTAAIAAASSGGAGLATGDISATQDRFLTLLVAQMRNQDPLNPLQNSEVTSQLAQLSTVTGINRLGELVSGLTSSFTQAQSLQAASLIGHNVIVPGNALSLTNGEARAAVDLPQAVEQLSISIRNSAGAIVHTANLGAQSAGLVQFAWDGANDTGTAQPDGLYTFEVQGVAGGKQLSNLTPYANARVNSVSLGSQGAELNVDGLGAVKLSQVKQIV